MGRLSGLRKTDKSKDVNDFGFQSHFYCPPFSTHRVCKILEDFKSDCITLEDAVYQIKNVQAEEKTLEETDSKYKYFQYKFNI